LFNIDCHTLLQRMLDDSSSVKEFEVTVAQEQSLEQTVIVEADSVQTVNHRSTGVVNKLLEVKRRRQQSTGKLIKSRKFYVQCLTLT